MLDELRQDYDLSILMTTHDFGMLPRYADHVVLIDHAIVTQGSAVDVLTSDGFNRVFRRKGASQ
jgi:zinc transport system ATP-binding protein